MAQLTGCNAFHSLVQHPRSGTLPINNYRCCITPIQPRTLVGPPSLSKENDCTAQGCLLKSRDVFALRSTGRRITTPLRTALLMPHRSDRPSKSDPVTLRRNKKEGWKAQNHCPAPVARFKHAKELQRLNKHGRQRRGTKPNVTQNASLRPSSCTASPSKLLSCTTHLQPKRKSTI